MKKSKDPQAVALGKKSWKKRKKGFKNKEEMSKYMSRIKTQGLKNK